MYGFLITIKYYDTRLMCGITLEACMMLLFAVSSAYFSLL